MRVAKGGTSGQATARPNATFTGDVFMDPVFSLNQGVAVATVMFTPGARTYWHSHKEGQILFVARGRGVVVNREGHHAELVAGDVVHADPGEVHWHGGSADGFMIHSAVSLGETIWLGEVDQEDYNKFAG